MPPPSLRLLMLLVPAVLVTLATTVSTSKATMITERSPNDFEEVKNTTSTLSTPAVLTQTARELAADPRAPQDNALQKPTSPSTHLPTLLVNNSTSVKRKRPPRIRLIKIYKKVWRNPNRKKSSLDSSSGNATEASNRTLSQKQPASITVIELPLKALPDEDKIESIMQLQQSSFPFNNSYNDDKTSNGNENQRNEKQNILAESSDKGGGILERRVFGNESFERTYPPLGVEKQMLVPSSDIQGYSDTKRGKYMSSVSDGKNSKPNSSHPSDSDKKEDSDDEYAEITRGNKNNLQRNKNTSPGVVERFLDIQSEEIQDLNKKSTQTRISGQNMRNESNEHTINKHNDTTNETTVNQDLNCTTDTNPSDNLLSITSCQYGSAPNESEKSTQGPVIHDGVTLNEHRYETSTGVSERESILKNSSNSNTTNGLSEVEETDIENEDSTLASNQFNGKEHSELINETDITTELSSKEIIQVLERGEITTPIAHVPSTDKHKDLINGANYLTEMGEIHRGVPEKFDEVNSKAKSGIIHSSSNFEDSPQVNGSISRNIPNLQDNLDSRSTALTANLSDPSTSISKRESAESVLNARMSGNRSYPDIPTELGSKSRVEEVIERDQFTVPVDDISLKDQHLVTVSNGNDLEKVEINRRVPAIKITIANVNSTTEPDIIQSSANLEDIPREYDSIGRGMFYPPQNQNDVPSIDISSSILKLSTIIPTIIPTKDSTLTERKTEESFDSDFTTEITSRGTEEEIIESDQFSIPIDSLSSKEQHQDSINNTNDNPKTGKIHRIFTENSQKLSGDVPEIFEDGNTTIETGVTDFLGYFEDTPRGYDSIPRSVPNLQESTSNTQSSYLDTNRSKLSTNSATVEHTLKPMNDSEITTELSSKGTVGKELENSNFVTTEDSENNKEQNETSENEKAYFAGDTFTSESTNLLQSGKNTKEFGPIANDTNTEDHLFSSSSINEFSSLTQPESSASLVIGELKKLENKTFTYSFINTDFSSEEDEEKESFTISNVETRKDEHGNNEEKINTEYHLDNFTRETDSPNVLRLLPDVQDEYKETLSQLNPLNNTHFTKENFSARNSESPTTLSMEIRPNENKKLVYVENVTNIEKVIPDDVIEFTEMPHVSVSSETSTRPIREVDTTTESKTTSDFHTALFANISKIKAYLTSSMVPHRNEEKDGLPSRTPSQNMSNDFTENYVKFLPEGSTETVSLNDVSQEHTEQSIVMQTENLAHLNDFREPLILDIASDKGIESLDRVENKNYSGLDMTTQVTEVMTDPLFSESNPESRKTNKYSELTQIPTLVTDKNVNSEVARGSVYSDRLKTTHKSIYSNEAPTRYFPQKETNTYNIPTLPQTHKHNYKPNNLKNHLISALKTISIPTMKVDMCQTPPNTPKIKHSRIHTSQKDSSKMKIIVRDEARRILSKMVPIDKTVYRNILRASSLGKGSALNKQVTQQNEEPLLKHIRKEEPERASFSTGKQETNSRHSIPRINCNSRPPLSPITLQPATSDKLLPKRAYSSSYPVCFCPLEDRLVANDEPKTNSQVVLFYNRRIQTHDQQRDTGKLHTGRSQSPPFESLIKQRPSSAHLYSKPQSETSYSELSPDLTEDGVPDSMYEDLIQGVENRPRTFDVLDYDYDNNDPITPQVKRTLETSVAFHPRRKAFMIPAHHNGRRDLPQGAHVFLGRSLLRSALSFPKQDATKADLFSTCYCIPASISDPLPDSPVPSLLPASFPIPFPTPLLEPSLAFAPAPIPPPFIANTLVRIRSPGYSISNSIPAISPSPMSFYLSKFGALPPPFPTSVFNPILVPPSASIPASDPALACNTGLVPYLPVPILNTIPAPTPMFDSVFSRTTLDPILDPTIINPVFAHFPAPNPDDSLANIFAPLSDPTSNPFMPVFSPTPTSITSYLPLYTPWTSCEDKNWFWLEKLLLFYPEFSPVFAPASFAVPAQSSALSPVPFSALDPASSPIRRSAPEHAPFDMASSKENRRGLWTGDDPWYFTFNDKSPTKPMHLLPSDSTSIPSASWMSPPPLSPPPLPLPPLLHPPPTSPPPPSSTSCILLPLLTTSLPPSQAQLPLSQFTPSHSPSPTPPSLTLQKRSPAPPSLSPQSRTHPLPPLTFLPIPMQTPPSPSLLKRPSYAPIPPPPPLSLQTKPPTLPPAPLLPKLESSTTITVALSAPQLSRTPPLPLLAFLSTPLQTPPPPSSSLLKLLSHAPIRPLTLQTSAPTPPPVTLLPEFELSISLSKPSAPSAPQPPTLPPSWLPLPLLLLYSSRSPHLQLPPPFPPPVALPSDQPASISPCTRSLQIWYERISALIPAPDQSTLKR